MPDDDGYYSIELQINTELSYSTYEDFVEESIDYGARAKWIELEEKEDGSIYFEWCSQEDMDEDIARQIGVLTNEYLVERDYIGVEVQGKCLCRDYPDDDFPITFTTYPNLTESSMEINIEYAWMITDDFTGGSKDIVFTDLDEDDWSEAETRAYDRCKEIQQNLIDEDSEEHVYVELCYGRKSSLPDDGKVYASYAVNKDKIWER